MTISAVSRVATGVNDGDKTVGNKKRIMAEEVIQAFNDLFNAVPPETPKEVDETLRKEGYDPDEVLLRMWQVANKYLSNKV